MCIEAIMVSERDGHHVRVSQFCQAIAHGDQVLLARQSHQVAMKDEQGGAAAKLSQRPVAPGVVDESCVADVFTLGDHEVVVSAAASRSRVSVQNAKAVCAGSPSPRSVAFRTLPEKPGAFQIDSEKSMSRRSGHQADT